METNFVKRITGKLVNCRGFVGNRVVFSIEQRNTTVTSRSEIARNIAICCEIPNRRVKIVGFREHHSLKSGYDHQFYQQENIYRKYFGVFVGKLNG